MKNFDFPTRVIENIDFFDKYTLEKYFFVFRKNPYILIKNDVYEKFSSKIHKIFKKENIIEFFGECSKIEIARLKKIFLEKKATSIIGMGGGKLLDTAKAIGNEMNIPIITLPTSSSQGASSSALSAIYNENHIIDECRDIIFTKAPDFVFIDYYLLLDEPQKFLIFGMTDSLAKYYEAYAFTSGKSENIFTQVALNLAKYIKKTIFKTSEKAVLDFKNHKLTDDLKNIFKINLVLAPMVGGIGGEGCRVCISHAVNNSLTQIERIRKLNFMHGEQVAFGNLLQLYLDPRDETKKELEELLSFHKKFNLMTDFTYFSNEKLSEHEKNIFINYIFSDVESLKNMPQKVSKNQMLDAMKFFKMI